MLDLPICRLQFLLAPNARDPAEKEALKRDLAGLGVQLSGDGAATLSGRIDEAGFRRLFGREAVASADEMLPLPASLRGRVTSVTLAPPHLELG